MTAFEPVPRRFRFASLLGYYEWYQYSCPPAAMTINEPKLKAAMKSGYMFKNKLVWVLGRNFKALQFSVYFSLKVQRYGKENCSP